MLAFNSKYTYTHSPPFCSNESLYSHDYMVLAFRYCLLQVILAFLQHFSYVLHIGHMWFGQELSPRRRLFCAY